MRFGADPRAFAPTAWPPGLRLPYGLWTCIILHNPPPVVPDSQRSCNHQGFFFEPLGDKREFSTRKSTIIRISNLRVPISASSYPPYKHLHPMNVVNQYSPKYVNLRSQELYGEINRFVVRHSYSLPLRTALEVETSRVNLFHA